MYALISVLILIACILLILIVLVQNSKGGGLTANFSGSNQLMGVRKTADFLEKATWTLAVFLLVLCLGSSMTIPREQQQEESLIQEQVNNAVDQVPALPNNPGDYESGE
jgi:preprotein translocase subunit SecG